MLDYPPAACLCQGITCVEVGEPLLDRAALGAPGPDVPAGHLLDWVGVLLPPRLNRVDVEDSDPPGAIPEDELERAEPWLSGSVGAEGEVIRAILGDVRPARSDPPDLEVAGPEDLAGVGAVCLSSHQKELKASVESRVTLYCGSALALREEICRKSGAGKSLDATERDQPLDISRDECVARLCCALAERRLVDWTAGNRQALPRAYFSSRWFALGLGTALGAAAAREGERERQGNGHPHEVEYTADRR
jgi:hypothetical protein